MHRKTLTNLALRRTATWLPALAVPLAALAMPAVAAPPDFGPNVQIFDPSTPVSTIQAALDAAFNSQKLSPTAQFGTQRYAFLFKPGSYAVNANVGFYTSVSGLGRNVGDVTVQEIGRAHV